MLTPQIWWYLSRGSGIVAWMTTGATCFWGILMVTRAFRAARPAWMLDLHRWFGALTIITTTLHLVALVADNYVHFGWREILLPGASEWKASAVTWGVLALYLMLAIQATSLVMHRLPRRLWHGVHLFSYVMFGFATVHGALAGTDRANRPYVLAVVLAVTTIVLGLVVRITRRAPKRPTRTTVPRAELTRTSR